MECQSWLFDHNFLGYLDLICPCYFEDWNHSRLLATSLEKRYPESKNKHHEELLQQRFFALGHCVRVLGEDQDLKKLS